MARFPAKSIISGLLVIRPELGAVMLNASLRTNSFAIALLSEQCPERSLVRHFLLVRDSQESRIFRGRFATVSLRQLFRRSGKNSTKFPFLRDVV
jgi:hypothetical protein